MRIHHLNCGTMCPLGGPLMWGRVERAEQRKLVCQCLLIETEAHGLVLVDTGLGLGDVRKPERLSGMFRRLMRLPLREDETALRRIERLGFHASDVRHIVLTHLDFDHAGGIEDFPQAEVHVLAPELAAAREGRRGFIARRRYRPQQWDAAVAWRTYPPAGEPWFGFAAVRQLAGLPPEILLVPLHGHTWGHAGVAVARSGGWLLHAGDAYFHRAEMDAAQPGCTPGLRLYQAMMEVDRTARLENQARLRQLAATAREVRVTCAHDAVELERLQAEA